MPNFEAKLKALPQVVEDTSYLYPWKSVSEYLDPGMWEAWHDSTQGPFPFLNTAPPDMILQPFNLTESTSDWIFWILLTGFVILTMTRYYHEKRLKLLGSSIFKRSASIQLIRESPVHSHRSFFPLFSIYIISISLLLYEAAEIMSPGSSEGLKTLLIFTEFLGAYLAYSLLKILAIWLISITFKNPDTAKEYIQNILIYNLVLGVLMLPLLILIIYTYHEIFLYLAGAIALIILSLRFIRGIVIGLSDPKFSLFHLFLYLCTLEILPIAFTVKFVSKYFFS